MPHDWLHGGVLQNPGLQRLVSWAQAACDGAVGLRRRRRLGRKAKGPAPGLLVVLLLTKKTAPIEPPYLVQPAQLHKGAHAKRHLYLRAARRRRQQRQHTKRTSRAAAQPSATAQRFAAPHSKSQPTAACAAQPASQVQPSASGRGCLPAAGAAGRRASQRSGASLRLP